ncbi:MAG TPA: cellobiose phosphorylase [Methylocella sp.]|nr:cellobiose phosphorylase [Methylocella sp.]
MSPPGNRSWTTPPDESLGLLRVESDSGLSFNFLPNGCLFSIVHRRPNLSILVNQLLGSPIGGGIARTYLRIEGEAAFHIEAAGPANGARIIHSPNCFVWEGETGHMRYRLALNPQRGATAWVWHLEVTNIGAPRSADAVFVQDIGLGERAFLMNNEAYASQYIDHHITAHPIYGSVVMSRQNLPQGGQNPWVAHGCLDGAARFATDGIQVFGPAFRDSNEFVFPFGAGLPSHQRQHELACAAIQSKPVFLSHGESATFRFFGLYEADHREASSELDLARFDKVDWRSAPHIAAPVCAKIPIKSIVEDAPAARPRRMGDIDLVLHYPQRLHEEIETARILSFFTPQSRHVVLAEEELLVTRRHGTLLRSGRAILPDDATLCATCWMHGVFAAQLTIGNTSFHKLFSVSRDPYNITRASGLRMMVDEGDGWRLLAVPSTFEMGLSDCRWIYVLENRKITVDAIASGDDPAMQWRITVDGEACPFLIFGHLVIGERELESAGLIEIDQHRTRFVVRPDPKSIWGDRYPNAAYHVVTSTPDEVEAIGGDELLYNDTDVQNGAYLTIRTKPTRAFSFAITGSMIDADLAQGLAEKYCAGVADESLLESAASYWSHVTRDLVVLGHGEQSSALNTLAPWLAHNAMIHLTVPHGLEQYTGAAWGTRDVCQGAVEFLLALEHDAEVEAILRILFAQQYESTGDWPQWFMLEPYSVIQDRTSHGDIIVWPLKALNDYLEATGDFDFLDAQIAWRRDDNFNKTERRNTVTQHIEKLLDTVEARFIRGTHLVRYGKGDWNDSLQPADPKLHDIMVSSWTVALLFGELNRYARALERGDRGLAAGRARNLALKMGEDFNRFLIRDGTVAGYAIFEDDGQPPELLLHPSDSRTGLNYSLLPMTQGILSRLFTPEQTAHHLELIRKNLLFPDGVRLMDRPVAYHGGLETTFRRAESAAFFGREIGLMYVHAHLRFAEAMALLGEAGLFFEALQLANPVTVAEHLGNAMLRQRNAYFSSSDAAFADRYAASEEWAKVKSGEIGVDGGWRIYSSGPGIFTGLIVRYVLGQRRLWGERQKPSPLTPPC